MSCEIKRDIVLIGTEDFDATTDLVMEWLMHYGQRVVRLNMEDSIKIVGLSYFDHNDIDFELLINEKQIVTLRQIKAFWLRRSGINITSAKIKFSSAEYTKATVLSINRHLVKEVLKIEEFVNFIVGVYPEIKVVGTNCDNSSNSNNKLINLFKASKVGLLTPETHIVTNKEQLRGLFDKTERWIVKTISDMPSISYSQDGKNHQHMLYANVVNISQLNEFPAQFFPSLFQVYLEKRIELRIFIFGEKLYTMAIFSQLDSQTQVDFRRYNKQKPNRYVPFDLPTEIAEKIQLFMKSIRLDSGSIDMIYTPGGDYYFLEVNPVGQFGMVSFPCNYYIEKQIAEYLIA